MTEARGGYHCTNPGCDYSAVVHVLVRDHMKRCPYRPTEEKP